MRSRILLCDSDREYSERISGYVRESEFRKEMEITIATQPDRLPELLEEGRFDAYVIDVGYAPLLKDKAQFRDSIIWLGEQKREEGPNGAPVLSKYDAAPRLLRSWLFHLDRNRMLPSKQAHLISVWSAGGGAGKTKIASYLSDFWVGMGLRAFIVGIDPGLYVRISGNQVIFHDLSDWLYAIKSGGKPTENQELCRQTADYHLFLPDSSYREWFSLGRRETGKLLEQAATLFDCDIVLVDAGSAWSEFIEEVWFRSDLVLCVTAEDGSGLLKTDKWLKDWPDWHEGGPLWEKTTFVINRSLTDSDSSYCNESWFTQAFRLPYVPEWKQTVSWNDPVFQQKVSQLAGELWSRCIKN